MARLVHLVATTAHGEITNEQTRRMHDDEITDFIQCQQNNRRTRYVHVTIDGEKGFVDFGDWSPARRYIPSPKFAAQARMESLATMAAERQHAAHN